MISKRSRRSSARRGVARCQGIESLESRQMFAVDPLSTFLGASLEHHISSEPDFWYDASAEQDLDGRIADLEQTLAIANELTGLTRARNDYGFTGIGQTVAVIDSGIAWDHPNLGGGFGSSYRVVGGWDFTEENDANPYDDGPAGAHGTHVAGIVGATKGTTGDEGVAPGVDLVGLRVFNDQGAGYFGWVEKALRWVHTNRNAFASPITAVNLSLGTAWNAATVPSWSMLEDEFAQLKADGIFVSVSAGNSFTTYKTPGLSYPAASSSVVPVMSVDDNGSLSYFSQRHSRAIAAPGRTVRSTVPDYVGNQNGQADDWASFSGTSMAAPYVAGASVLIREAMQFVGITNITQDTIYQHMMSTADDVFDAATNAVYKRLNVGAALDALMPEDDFGSTVDDASDLGVIGADGAKIGGMIGNRSDVDYFRFTASVSGTVTFSAATTHYLAAQWTGSGTASTDGLSYTVNVVAGQSYTIGLGTSGGIGHFELSITAETAFTFVDWGAVSQQQVRTGVGVNGESWYCVTAEQAGYLTAEAFYSANCQVEIAWFDTNLQQVASGAVGTLNAECQRVDRYVNAGEQLFLRVSGNGTDVNVRLTNLVSIEDGILVVSATDGDDTLAFVAGSGTQQVVVNGVSYTIDASAVQSVQIDAGVGKDAIEMYLTPANESITLHAGSFALYGNGFTVLATSVERISARSGGGNDLAAFYDSAGDDVFTAYPDRAVMQGSDFMNVARGFAQVVAYDTYGGNDRAVMYDSDGDDVFTAYPDRAVMQGDGYFNVARRFGEVVGYSIFGGKDRAVLYDSAENDVFTAYPDRVVMQGAGYINVARRFGEAVGYSIFGGNDRTVLYDSGGNDVFTAYPDRAVMQGIGYINVARRFDEALAYSIFGGKDRAVLYDSAGNDVFTAYPDRAVMQGVGYINVARRFGEAVGYSIFGGNDRAVLYDSTGDDVFTTYADRAVMQGSGFTNVARGFGQVLGHSLFGGADRAVLYDSTDDDTLLAEAHRVRLAGDEFCNDACGFQRVAAYLIHGGTDETDVDLVDYIFNLIGQQG